MRIYFGYKQSDIALSNLVGILKAIKFEEVIRVGINPKYTFEKKKKIYPNSIKLDDSVRVVFKFKFWENYPMPSSYSILKTRAKSKGYRKFGKLSPHVEFWSKD